MFRIQRTSSAGCHHSPRAVHWRLGNRDNGEKQGFPKEANRCLARVEDVYDNTHRWLQRLALPGRSSTGYIAIQGDLRVHFVLYRGETTIIMMVPYASTLSICFGFSAHHQQDVITHRAPCTGSLETETMEKSRVSPKKPADA